MKEFALYRSRFREVADIPRPLPLVFEVSITNNMSFGNVSHFDEHRYFLDHRDFDLCF